MRVCLRTCVHALPVSASCAFTLRLLSATTRVSFASSLAAPQVIKGFCEKSDGKDKLTALIQVCGFALGLQCYTVLNGLLLSLHRGTSPWCQLINKLILDSQAQASSVYV